MGKIVEKKRKKKKGRPSLLDIQKRNLKLQQEQQLQQKRNPNPNPNSYSNPNLKTPIPPNSNRRFTRRNPDPDGIAAEDGTGDDEDNDDDHDEQESKGNRRERKLNHVLRAPSNQRSSINSPYLDLGLYGSDSNEEDEEGETPLKKRKINAAADGSAKNDGKKGEKQSSGWKATEKHLGKPSESGPTTPLPDKKLLAFILDRLQKKDTYGVYSEPVDPEELPDYHEIISNPMDFGTVRKKLGNGAYADLEQFENDVFLICSNAMQYNAPDTIYFRQARTIQELAKKDFENLRHDSDNEQEPKIVRRGRPPKNLKKIWGKTSSERDGLDAALTQGGDNAVLSNTYNLRKGRLPDKYVAADASRRTSYGSRNSEAYSWLSEHKFDRSDEFSGSSMKGFSMRYGKKQSVLDESRRNTYTNFHPSVGGSDSSVLNAFDGEIKQLLPVGLHNEHGYARSLARFAANLGPVAWKVASRKIERSLPPGTKFGPGWVGDDDAPAVQVPSLTTSFASPLPQQQTLPLPQTSSSTAVPLMVDTKGDVLSKQDFTNTSSLVGHLSRTSPSTVASSSTFVSRSPESIAEPVEAASRIMDGGFGLLSNGSGGIRPPFQIHQSSLITPVVNGFSGGFGPNLSPQADKVVQPAWSAGSLSADASVHSRIFDMVSKSNFLNSKPTCNSELYTSSLSGGSSAINPGALMPHSNHENQAGNGVGIDGQTCWNGLLPSQKQDTVPPDLNLRFQSPGSPNPSVRVETSHPDLALQL